MTGFNQIFNFFVRQNTEKGMLSTKLGFMEKNFLERFNNQFVSKMGYSVGFYEHRHWLIKHIRSVKMSLQLRKMKEMKKFRLDF